MITTSRLLNASPRGHLYGTVRDYHHARPGHSARPQTIVSGIQEQDAQHVPGDLLGEWDILLYPRTDHAGTSARGDIVAHRVLRRARHSRTTIVSEDSHPVILLAADVLTAHASDAWLRVLQSAERGGTLSDVLLEYRDTE